MMTNSELKNELETVENEFNSLKIAVATGLQRLDDLSKNYMEIMNEIKKRDNKQ